MEAISKVKPLNRFKGMTPDTIEAIKSGQVWVGVVSGYNISNHSFYAGLSYMAPIERCLESFDPAVHELAANDSEVYANELRESLKAEGIQLIDCS